MKPIAKFIVVLLSLTIPTLICYLLGKWDFLNLAEIWPLTYRDIGFWGLVCGGLLHLLIIAIILIVGGMVSSTIIKENKS